MKALLFTCALLSAALFLCLPGRSHAGSREFAVRVRPVPLAGNMAGEARVIAMARARRELLAAVGRDLGLVPAVKQAKLSEDSLLALAAALVSPHVISPSGDKKDGSLEDLAFVAELDTTAIHSQVKDLLEEQSRLRPYRIALDSEKKLLAGADLILAGLAADQASPKNEANILELQHLAVRLAAISLTHMANEAFLKSPSDMDKAWEYYTGAIRLDPECGPAYTSRAVWLMSKNNFQEAVVDLTRAIQILPDDAAARQNRGVAYAELGRPDLAVSDFTRAIELNPENIRVRVARGFARILSGDKADGCDDLSFACRLGQCAGLKRARREGFCP